MSSFTWLLIVVGYIVVTLAIAHNTFSRKQEDVRAAWSNVEVELNRRFELISNLAASVKGFTGAEQSILGDISTARGKLGGVADPTVPLSARVTSGNELAGLLGRLLIVLENYPDIKASQHYSLLSTELMRTEARIAKSRLAYNQAVKKYNRYYNQFGGRSLARLLGFAEQTYFSAPTHAAIAPCIDATIK